jgi:huntingtin-interacting protein 1-related protein
MWKNKYEQLAKLYSQLRQEHLDLLQKYKSMQLKANSAQEAIDRKERIEREMKSKNLELADMIRERDRARYELDRLKGSNKDELEKLKRELRFAKEKADDLDRSKSSELSAMLSKYNREMADLEEALHVRAPEYHMLINRRRRGHWKTQVDELVTLTVSLMSNFAGKTRNSKSTKLALIPRSSNSRNFNS